MKNKPLIQMRKQLNLTQAALGAEVGVDGNTVARWERGEIEVPIVVEKLLRTMVRDQRTSSVIANTGIGRDPYHNAILAALNGHLDPEEFEACVAVLLSEIYPTLTPVRGGADDGFDGAITDGNRPPFPLVTTTGTDARGNLRRNLKRAHNASGKLTKAVFASSRRLTPSTRADLKKIAAEFGIRALQIHDQDWMANALYRDPGWAKKLLNVTGKPSALTLIPHTSRLLLGDQIIGRQQELQALRDIKRDLILVGGPGSGKTFLLSALAREDLALFLASDSQEEIANSVRSQRPRAIIVDDAHLQTERIPFLTRLRQEIEADYKIIAVSWPGKLQTAKSAFGVASFDVIELPLIDADTMVEVVRSVGLSGPNGLIASIVHQSEGRPGLAATLAHLCLRGSALDVVSGQALVDDLLPNLVRVVGEDPARLLACFSLGGAEGVSIEFVAKHLSRPLDQVSTILAGLAAAGVIREGVTRNSISVWPEHLRWILVKDVFFSGPGSFAYEPFIEQASSQQQAVMTLIGARSRGAAIPELEDLVERNSSTELWGSFASLGVSEARYVVRSHRELVAEIAPILLEECAEEVLPILLSAAIGDDRRLNSSPDHPLRRIEEWVTPPSSQAMQRDDRSAALIAAVRRWWREHRSEGEQVGNIAIRAFSFAFAPSWESTEADPGYGRTITFSSGIVGETDSAALLELWGKGRDILTLGVHSAWEDLISLAEDWSVVRANVEVSESLISIRRRFAEQILNDLSAVTKKHLGMQQQISKLASARKYNVDAKVDEDFEILFPSRDEEEEYPEQALRWSRAASALGRAWSKETPASASKRIAELEKFARDAGITWPRLTNILFESISDNVTNYSEWVDSLMSTAVPGDLVIPFVRKIIAAGRDAESEHTLHTCLQSDRYSWIGITVAMGMATIPSSVMRQILDHAKSHIQLIETNCLREEVSRNALECLLNCNDIEVALAGAIGEWNAAKHKSRRIQLEAAWRSAVLRSVEATEFSDHSDYWLAEIFKKDGELGFEWLLKLNLIERSYRHYDHRKIAKKALQSLNKAQRLQIIEQLRPQSILASLVQYIVGDDPELFKSLLKREELERYHLKPIGELPSPQWRERAILVLDVGHTHKEVLDATTPNSWRWGGPESAMWLERKNAFDAFIEDDDRRIAAIAREASQALAKRIEACLERERAEAVRGRSRN